MSNSEKVVNETQEEIVTSLDYTNNKEEEEEEEQKTAAKVINDSDNENENENNDEDITLMPVKKNFGAQDVDNVNKNEKQSSATNVEPRAMEKYVTEMELEMKATMATATATEMTLNNKNNKTVKEEKSSLVEMEKSATIERCENDFEQVLEMATTASANDEKTKENKFKNKGNGGGDKEDVINEETSNKSSIIFPPAVAAVGEEAANLTTMHHHQNATIEVQQQQQKQQELEHQLNYSIDAVPPTGTSSGASSTQTQTQTTNSPLLQRKSTQQQQQHQQQLQKQPHLQSLTHSMSCDSPCVENKTFDAVNTSTDSLIKFGRKTSDVSPLTPRRVSFPKSDKELVTSYLEPANPWEHACLVGSISEIAELYVSSCKKHNTKPLPIILDHLRTVVLNKQIRQQSLSLSGIKLTSSDCEALEEVFKRVQYKSLNVSFCGLSESAASALFEMIEYYEATQDLNISSNSTAMTHRGWNSCSYMVSHSQELRILNAYGNPLSKSDAENLGHALSTSNLHTIKLEHCGLKGSPLSGLCSKIRSNRTLKELWLASNDLDFQDARCIAELLRVNHYIELVDISNNNIRDEGLRYIVDALVSQAHEHRRRTAQQYSISMDTDDESYPLMRNNTSPCVIERDVHILTSSDSDSSVNGNNKSMVGSNDSGLSNTSLDSVEDNFETLKMRSNIDAENNRDFPLLLPVPNKPNFGILEDTLNSSNDKSFTQPLCQSMLDKLLSMNSDNGSANANAHEDMQVLTPTTVSSVSPATVPPEAATTTREWQLKLEHDLEIGIQDSIKRDDNDANKNLNGTSNGALKADDSESKSSSSVEELHQLLVLPTLNSVTEKNVTVQDTEVFEVTAVESDCLIPSASTESEDDRHLLFLHSSKALNVNKNPKCREDNDDTYSTDSAFESASEGDISRHLPEEYRRSVALKKSNFPLDEIAKELALKSATIVTEATEATEEEQNMSMPMPPTPPLVKKSTDETVVGYTSTPSQTTPLSSSPHTQQSNEMLASNFPLVEFVSAGDSDSDRKSPDSSSVTTHQKVAFALETYGYKHKNISFSTKRMSPSLYPGGSPYLTNAESSSPLITQSTRNYSQSSDSLCSDNSLDGSICSELNFSPSTHINEKLTKNDTLTRQQRHQDICIDTGGKTPDCLKALLVWNNNLTRDSGCHIANLLRETASLELLNVGKNYLSNDFVSCIKENLTRNTTLSTLGLQSAHLSAKGIETLASILTFGGNDTLRRIDIRGNKLDPESLAILAEVLKSNKTVTQIDIDDEPKRLSVGSDAHLDYARLLENVRSSCSRNEKLQTQQLPEKATNLIGDTINLNNSCTNKRGGYAGSRKISLTCQTRPLIDITSSPCTIGASSAKLDVKRKMGVRLISPIPSPPTISPSSSPNRSRFQVVRVVEDSPPSQTAIAAAALRKSVTATSTSNSNSTTHAKNQTAHKVMSNLAPTFSSLPSLTTASAESSPPSKRLSMSSRSRFHVSRIYENPNIPLSKRFVPPVTPPLHLPPTPMNKTPKIIQQMESNAGQMGSESSVNSVNSGNSVSSVNSVNSECELNLVTKMSSNNHNNSNNATNSTSLDRSTDTINSDITPYFPTSSSPFSSSCSTSAAVAGAVGLPTLTTSSSLPTLTSLPTLEATTAPNPPSSKQSFEDNSQNEESLTEPAPYIVAPPTKQCPILVFSNSNDITITKNTDNRFSGINFSPSPSSNSISNPIPSTSPSLRAVLETFAEKENERIERAAKAENENKEAYATNHTKKAEEAENIESKTNLVKIGDATAGLDEVEVEDESINSMPSVLTPPDGVISKVNKLFTLFNKPSSVFPQNLAPVFGAGVISGAGSMSAQGSYSADNTLTSNSALQQQQQQQQQEQQLQQPNSLLPTRKHSLPGLSWTKIGTDLLNASVPGREITNAAVATAANATLEQSKSLLDAASKQLRDLSKQVLRQNLSFGKEANPQTKNANNINTQTTTITTSATMDATGGSGSDGSGGNAAVGSNGMSAADKEHDAGFIPTDVKQEIKENISPEHTINEDTLQNIQKFGIDMDSGGEGSTITTITCDIPSFASAAEAVDDQPTANKTDESDTPSPTSSTHAV